MEQTARLVRSHFLRSGDRRTTLASFSFSSVSFSRGSVDRSCPPLREGREEGPEMCSLEKVSGMLKERKREEG